MAKNNGVAFDVNILDTADKSFVDNVTGKMRKIDRYGWTMTGKMGVYAEIDKNLLRADIRYQREEISEKKVVEIASAWDWAAIGTLIVVDRNDGYYWVLDGGHRARASFYRDDVHVMPCIVHQLKDVRSEAVSFVTTNTKVNAVSSMDKFRAAVFGDQDEVAKATSHLLSEFGLTPVKGGHQTGKYISCIGALQSCVAVSLEDTRKVLGFCLKLAGEYVVVGTVLQAMFTLHQHFKPAFDVIDKFGHKISRHSQKEIEVKMRQFATECGKSGNVINAKAILELINHKNRNRIEW